MSDPAAERFDASDLPKYSEEDLYAALEHAADLAPEHPWREALSRELATRGR